MADPVGAVNNYECQKAVVRSAGLKKLAGSKQLGIITTSVSILLSEQRTSPSALDILLIDADIEFICVLRSNNRKAGPDSYMGFHFFGTLVNLQRCFSDPTRHAPDLAAVFDVIHRNITTVYADAYSCPLILIGDTNDKGYWQLSMPDAPEKILGFIPLNRSRIFHSLRSHPIIFLEREKQSAGLVVISDVDRNKLLPAQPEVDAEYTETLRSIGASSAKWSHLSLPTGCDVATTGKHMAQLEAVPASLTLTFVSRVQLGRSSEVKDISAALLCSATTGGKSWLSMLGLPLKLESAIDPATGLYDLGASRALLESFVAEVKQYQHLFFEHTGGNAIYNPFLEDDQSQPPLVIESNVLLNGQERTALATSRSRLYTSSNYAPILPHQVPAAASPVHAAASLAAASPSLASPAKTTPVAKPAAPQPSSSTPTPSTPTKTPKSAETPTEPKVAASPKKLLTPQELAARSKQSRTGTEAAKPPPEVLLPLAAAIADVLKHNSSFLTA